MYIFIATLRIHVPSFESWWVRASCCKMLGTIASGRDVLGLVKSDALCPTTSSISVMLWAIALWKFPAVPVGLDAALTCI